MNTVNQDVIDKLTKILRLANDKRAQPGEIEAAFAKAKELAMRHQIDIAGIDINGQEDTKAAGIKVERGDVKIRSKKPQKYHRWICSVLNEVFGVRIIHCWQTYVFIGETTDVAICKMLFPWLEDVFYSTYNKAANAHIVERCAAAKNAIYAGLYQGMVEANKRAEQQFSAEDKSKWALVIVKKDALVEQRVKEEFPELRKARRSTLSYDHAGLRHGYNEGKKINLRQTSNGQESKQLN